MSRREVGRVYTPRNIAERIVHACLSRWLDERQTAADSRAGSTCRVLDPACGDGAFLLAVFDELCRRRRIDAASIKLAIVREHLFGADIDPAAVAALRARLVERIGAAGDLGAKA